MILKFKMMNIKTFSSEKERIFKEEVKYPLVGKKKKLTLI